MLKRKRIFRYHMAAWNLGIINTTLFMKKNRKNSDFVENRQNKTDEYDTPMQEAYVSGYWANTSSNSLVGKLIRKGSAHRKERVNAEMGTVN